MRVDLDDADAGVDKAEAKETESEVARLAEAGVEEVEVGVEMVANGKKEEEEHPESGVIGGYRMLRIASSAVRVMVGLEAGKRALRRRLAVSLNKWTELLTIMGAILLSS